MEKRNMPNTTCWRDGCSELKDKWGMCSSHYEEHVRLYRPSRPTKIMGTNEERFYAYLHKGADDECWIWGGALNDDGYGVFRLTSENGRDGKMVRTHRFAYELLVGRVPPKLEPDHTCRMRPCANPAHQDWVTQKVNTLRGIGLTAQNARKESCVQGHTFSEENTYVTPDGYRQCKTCQAEIAARDGAQNTRNYRKRHGLITGVGKGGYQKLRTNCPQGHPYNEENTIREGNRRRCRTCVNAKKRAWRESKKN